jgi:hypothetical protein
MLWIPVYGDCVPPSPADPIFGTNPLGTGRMVRSEESGPKPAVSVMEVADGAFVVVPRGDTGTGLARLSLGNWPF